MKTGLRPSGWVRWCAVLAALMCATACGDQTPALEAPYCGLFSPEEVALVIGEVEKVEGVGPRSGRCQMYGKKGILVAYASSDSWVDFGDDGNSALTTLSNRVEGEGRVIDGTSARVFTFDSNRGPGSQAYAYWLEGRAGFTLYTINVDGVDETTAAALEDLVVTYAPRVLEGEPAVTEDPGPDLHPTGVPSPPPSAEPTSAPPESPAQSEPPAGLTTPQ